MANTAEAHMRRTVAQRYCVLAGASLLVAGVLGFAADSGFDTGSHIQGDNFIVFEVNGWHNLIHIGSGLLLLAAANYRPTAKSVAMAFGIVYGFVALWGLIDGDEVFNLFPVNPADNLLHLFLSAAAILAAYVSPTTKGQQRERKARRRERRLDRKRGVKEVDAPVAGGTSTGRVHTPVGSPNDQGIPATDEGRFSRDPRAAEDRERLQ
jgi:hypothetical protein